MREKLIDLCKQANDELRLRAGCSTWGDFADILIDNGVNIPVRCKECEYRRGDFFGGFVCRLHKGLAMVTDESFCSYGERRKNAGTD